jgi:membrane protein
VLRKYHRDDCLSYAASVSFFLAISLIPLSTLFFKLMSVVLGNGAYSQRLQRAIMEMYPYVPDNFIRDTIAQSKRISGWGISWVILLIGANWGVTQLDRSLSHIFGLRVKPHRQTRKHTFLRRLGVVLAGLVFLVILLSAGFEWSLRRQAILSPTIGITVMPALLGLLLTTTILQHLPRRHVKFEHAFLGALVTTLLWWGAKWVFGIYYAHAKELTWVILYGSLGSMMAALVFLYYSCCIFLLGAEVTAAFYRQDTTTSLRVPEHLKR